MARAATQKGRDPSSAKSPRDPLARWSLLATLLIAFVSCAAFVPALRAGFSDFDDQGFLLEVTGWRGLAPDNLAWMFTTPHMGHYQPLTYLSYAIEYTLFGLEPAVLHATNIALHALSAVLLFGAVRRVLTLRAPVAWPAQSVLLASAIAALAWAVHPLRVEAVAWVTERRDVLSMALLLAAFHAYLRAVAPQRAEIASRGWFVAMHVFLLLSLLAKAWGITFFVVLVVVDWWALRRLGPDPLRWLAEPASRRVLAEKAIAIVLALAFMVLAAKAQQSASVDTVRTLAEWPLADRVAQACYGLVFYVWKTAVPTSLAALYELPAAIDFAKPVWWVCMALVAAGIVACILLRTRRPGLVAACVAYVAIVSPVLGLTQSGIQLVADRYSYVAIVPLMVLLAWGVAWLLTRRADAKPTTLTLAAAVLVGCTVLSWRQSTLWQSTRALWEHALAHGHDGPLLRNYYAQQLHKAGELDGAITQYERSIALQPTMVDSWFGLGLAQRDLRQFANAERSLRTAIDHAEAQGLMTTRVHMALGLLYAMHMNRPQDALASFEAGVASLDAHANPAQTGVPYLNLASAYGMLGDEAKARQWLEKAAKYPDAEPRARELLHDLGP